jgi:hypothetical protein
MDWDGNLQLLHWLWVGGEGGRERWERERGRKGGRERRRERGRGRWGWVHAVTGEAGREGGRVWGLGVRV